MATERFTLVLDTKTTGTQEILGLIESVKKLQAETAKAKATAADSSVSSAIGNNIKNFIQAPAAAATQAVEGLASSLGPAAVGAVAFGGAIAAAGTALFSLAAATGRNAEAQSNNAVRLGVSIKEYGLLSEVSKNAGLDADALVVTMKGLSKAVSDNSIEGEKGSKALRSLGLEARNAFGGMKGTSEFLLEIADKIGGLTDPYERAKKAQDIFGKAGLNILPLLNKELRGNVEELRKLGIGFDEVSGAKAKAFDDRLDLLISKIKQYGLELGVATIAEIDFFTERGQKEFQEKQRKSFADSNALRRGDLLSLDTKAFTAGLAPAGPTVADLNQTLQVSRRGAVRQALESDPITGIQERIKRAEADLADAVENGSAKQVMAKKAIIKSFEDQLAIQTKIRSIAEEGLTGGVLVAKGSGDHKLGAINAKRDEEGFVYDYEYIDENGQRVKHRAPAFNGLGTPKVSLPSLLTSSERANVSGYEYDVALGQTQGAGGTFTATQAASDEANKERLGAIGEMNAARIAGENEKSARNLQLSLEAERNLTEYGNKRIGILTGPGGEVAAINEIANRKLASLEKEIELGAEIWDAEQRRLEIRRDRELQILEIRKQQREQFQEFTSGIVGAAFGGGNSVQQYLRGQAQGIVTKLASNATGLLFPSGAPGILGSITGTAQNPTTIGKLLSGTLLGPKADQSVMAADRTTAAVDRTTAAVEALGEGLGISMPISSGTISSGSTGGGALGGVLGGIGSLFKGGTGGGLFGGIAGAGGLIFNAFGKNGGGSMVNDPAGDFSGIPTIPGIPASMAPDLKKSNSTLGYLGAAIGAGLGAYQISKGGAQNALGGAGAIAGSAASVLSLAGVAGPAAPIVAGIGAALGLAALIMGDPKKRRSDEESLRLKYNQFVAPESINASMDVGGGYSDYDMHGNVRTSSFSPFPVNEQPYFDYRRNTTVPGRTTSPFGGGNTTININAMDSQSFNSFLQNNPDALANGFRNAVNTGGNDIIPTIRGQL